MTYIIINIQCTCVKLICTTPQSPISPYPSIIYSSMKKYVNPLELAGFLHKWVIKCDLMFI